MAAIRDELEARERSKQTLILERLWDVYDADGNGNMEYSEFCGLMRDWFDAMYYTLPKLLTRNWIKTMKRTVENLRKSGRKTTGIEKMLEQVRARPSQTLVTLSRVINVELQA
jgi:hypothetical protein